MSLPRCLISASECRCYHPQPKYEGGEGCDQESTGELHAMFSLVWCGLWFGSRRWFLSARLRRGGNPLVQHGNRGTDGGADSEIKPTTLREEVFETEEAVEGTFTVTTGGECKRRGCVEQRHFNAVVRREETIVFMHGRHRDEHVHDHDRGTDRAQESARNQTARDQLVVRGCGSHLLGIFEAEHAHESGGFHRAGALEPAVCFLRAVRRHSTADDRPSDQHPKTRAHLISSCGRSEGPPTSRLNVLHRPLYADAKDDHHASVRTVTE